MSVSFDKTLKQATFKVCKNDLDTQVNQDTLLVNSMISSRKEPLYQVSLDDFNNDFAEPVKYFQDDLLVDLKIYHQKMNKSENIGDIFKNAEFWCNKGCIILGDKSSSHAVALDYYISGVKIDPSHFGCIYNIGCCHFLAKKY